MTLMEYIKSGRMTIPSMATALGVSTHGLRKWVYGQRAPDLATALEIVRLSGGKIKIATLVKSKPASNDGRAA